MSLWFNGEGEGKALLPGGILGFKYSFFGFFQGQGNYVGVTFGVGFVGNVLGLTKRALKNCHQHGDNKIKGGDVIVMDDDPVGPVQFLFIHHHKFNIQVGGGIGI